MADHQDQQDHDAESDTSSFSDTELKEKAEKAQKDEGSDSDHELRMSFSQKFDLDAPVINHLKKLDEQVMIAFVNGRSGGQLGQKVLKRFQKLLGEDRVYDLMEKPIGPEKGLQKWLHHKNLKVIAAGGDGTVGWILSVFDKMGFPKGDYPAVAILPLGTGNDMSRILRWGGGYSGGDLGAFINRIKDESVPIKLDRWKLKCVPLTPEEIEQMDKEYYEATGKKKKPKKIEKTDKEQTPQEIDMVFNNYFSVGIGAQIIEDFDSFRNKHPGWITSRAVGKGWYGALSFRRMCKPGTPVKNVVTAVLDGKQLYLSSKVRELTVLNIPSIMGGADVWGKYSDTKRQQFPPTINDNHFELVGVKGVSHMARLKAGVSVHGGMRVGQGKVLELRNRKSVNAQVDGEALLIPPCKITVLLHNQATLLLNTHGDKGSKQKKKLVGR
eukprot:TRINITY_DN9549_c0_g1_i1.p1 TRINITY_DN9549_c0_g1~~TRINITY_DN9549_c0_g1_i1.p1  ORF type:complete len:440 (+),score=98.55 TRINITY_DN9549_c0_g1_i1:59-1378(+)